VLVGKGAVVARGARPGCRARYPEDD
jgi:hypothetical protein